MYNKPLLLISTNNLTALIKVLLLVATRRVERPKKKRVDRRDRLTRRVYRYTNYNKQGYRVAYYEQPPNLLTTLSIVERGPLLRLTR